MEYLIIIEGTHDKAIVMVDQLEESAKSQIETYLNQLAFKGSEVVIMPDVHAGAGCVIGFTSKLTGRIVPNIVGVDIGCGVGVVNLGKKDINLERLDNFIKRNIPHGFKVHNKAKPIDRVLKDRMKKTSEKAGTSFERDLRSIGTLGGGNHFIEIGIDKDSNKHLLVHSGSRNFGYKVASHHQNIAKNYCAKRTEPIYDVPRSLAFLEGELGQDYLADMQVAVEMAQANRETISEEILRYLGRNEERLDSFTTIHNYIDLEGGYVRKGAISAYKDQRVVIPWNMRDGSVIAVGLGNREWNFSAPHGAGRLLSRRDAKKTLSVEKFISGMEGIYTTTATSRTVDESPDAYKDYQEILDKLSPTAKVIDTLKPIYNFKAY